MSNHVKRERLARLINSRVRKAGLSKHISAYASPCANGVSMFVKCEKKMAQAVFDAVGGRVEGGTLHLDLGYIFWEV